MIAALESGRDVDPDLLGEAVGMMIADAQKTPEQRLQDRRVELAALERKLGPGPKRGVVTRDKIRDEIEALEAMIESLEG